ncbi:MULTISPECIES: hypothetical protein [Methylobacterium]|uniref:Uncharacterized protein n=1 Tax=Methylobacterium jeotgali TaxID=381630 RepID=A0ABQ4T1I5_9HYPH|nr:MULTISPECIES: hypothetical protein [Methylobacterium]GBU18056.1 hypothetical protein AwMethylo_22710 [Methylobacterium sp.]GJE08659.1 hypothetical protein AOPFMNJM_4002 [Methylobacterium jeotgali]
MMRVRLARGAATALRGLSIGLLWIGSLSVPVLTASRWLDERARALDPELEDWGHR